MKRIAYVIADIIGAVIFMRGRYLTYRRRGESVLNALALVLPLWLYVGAGGALGLLVGFVLGLVVL